MSEITIRQGFWFDRTKIKLTFPDGWKVDSCGMASDGWKRLSSEDIKEAIGNPIGCARLEELARGKREAVVLFDDMTRPTRPYKVIPCILEALKAGGIRRDNIRFLASSGSHGAMRLDDFQKKLGKKTAAEYPVYNHNSFENTKYIGKTKTGVPVHINKEFFRCDLKIGIGTVLPHLYCGFSGGGKIVLPGICAYRTINAFHSLGRKGFGFANCRDNLRLRTINEASRMSGLQFKIDFIVNTQGSDVACFAGDPAEEFKKACETAKRAYRAPHGRDYDVIIANTYMKSNEADLAIFNTIDLLKAKKGIIVLVTDNTHGQVNHYLFRSYGKFIGGRRFEVRTFLRPNVKYIILSPNKECNAFDTFDSPGSLIWKKSWGEILKIIKEDFSNPKVAVFHDATVQLLRSCK